MEGAGVALSLLGPVYVILSLSARQEAALVASSQALERVAGALDGDVVERLALAAETFIARLDAAADLTPEQAAQVSALIAQLKASGDALGAAEAANP